MNAPILEIEGTWEEVAAHAPELVGRRVRLTTVPTQAEEKAEENVSLETRISTAKSLLKFAGTWAGDDLKERLQEAIDSRSQAKF